MTHATATQIELTEIADYRGNLSFAEENNPIPFAIQSVFWTTIKNDCLINIQSKTFLIILDGQVKVNDKIIDRPNLGLLIPNSTNVSLKLQSDKAIILLVMDRKIKTNDKAIQTNNGLLQMPTINDFSGLSGHFSNTESTLPFDIKRVYFTYDIPNIAKRGGHAHKNLRSVLFAIKGSFDVIIDSSRSKKKVHLDNKSKGLYINKGLWRELDNFKDKSIVLVLASERYCETDYIRNYRDFRH